MAKKRSRRGGTVWLAALLLFVCVAATTFALAEKMNSYQMDDSGAIDLMGGSSSTSGTNPAPTPEATPAPSVEVEVSAAPTVTEEPAPSSAPSQQPATTPNNRNPGFEVEDENTVWSTDTQVEIFRTSYENDQQQVTVSSSDGDKLIAPGTENSYTFKLKNTGNVPVDYTVEVDAFFTPDGTSIPIEARLIRYDGEWLVGDGENWGDVPELDTAADSGSIGADKFIYYSLDWRWSFEGNDALDTLLGNAAEEGEDLTLTVVIRTTAEANGQPDGPGFDPPQTGDLGSLGLWAALAAGSLIMLLILFFTRDKDKKRRETEEAAN